MTQVVLSIPDEKVKTFLRFINDLSYVKIEEKDLTIPDWQQKEVRKRLKKIKASPETVFSSREAHKLIGTLKQ